MPIAVADSSTSRQWSAQRPAKSKELRDILASCSGLGSGALLKLGKEDDRKESVHARTAPGRSHLKQPLNFPLFAEPIFPAPEQTSPAYQ